MSSTRKTLGLRNSSIKLLIEAVQYEAVEAVEAVEAARYDEVAAAEAVAAEAVAAEAGA